MWQTTTAIGGGSGRPDRFVSILSDITDVWRTNERIRHLAFYDALTDLPNRSLLYDRLANLIGLAESEHQALAVLFIDVDGFKGVKDTHGHEVGDHLLTIVAHRLRDAVRRSDTVSRYGGDEFVVLLIDSGTERDGAAIAAKIIVAINEPVISVEPNCASGRPSASRSIRATAAHPKNSWPRRRRDVRVEKSRTQHLSRRVTLPPRRASSWDDCT